MHVVKKRVWVSGLVLLLLIVGIAITMQLKRNPMKDVVRELRAAGLPTTKEELSALGPQSGTDGQKFYRLFDIGVTNYVREPGHKDDFQSLYLDQVGQSDKDKLALQARHLLAPTIMGSKCDRWVMDPLHGGRITDQSSGLDLLCLVAEADAREGRIDQALDELRSAERIVVQEWNNPSFSRMWTGLYREKDKVLVSFHKCMDAFTSDPAVLQRGEKFLESLPPQPSAYVGLKYDTGECGFDDWLGRSTMEIWRGDSEDPPSEIDKLKDKFWYGAKVLREQARYARLRLRIFKDLTPDVDWATASEINDRDWMDEEKRNGKFEFFDFRRVPDVQLTMWGENLTKRRVELAAIRIQERNVIDGVLPNALPDFGKDGLDPFTGKPLIYKRTANGFLVYGVGRDRTDNGGSSLHGADIVAGFE